MDNINFQGGFLIQKTGKVKWQNIEKALPRRKCLFQEFNDIGDKFVATKTHYDKDMLEMLLQKRVNFVFYPEINLKSRLDTYFPEEAHKIINSQTNIISSRKEQLKYLLGLKSADSAKTFTPHAYKWEPNDHINKTFKVLDLNPNEHTIVDKEGVTIICNKQNKKVAAASPNSINGVNYIYVFPQNSDKSPRRMAVNEFGEIEHEFSVFELENFNKLFKRAVKIDKGRIIPQKT